MQFYQRETHVRIPFGLFSTAMTAQLNLSSSIFFVAVRTVSVGEIVTTLKDTMIF